MPRKHNTRFITTMFLCIFCSLSPLKAQRAWRKIGDLQQARTIFGALPLSNRQILVMGGYTSGQVAATCELIDIESRSITRATPMNAPRAESAFLLTRDSNIVAISGLSTASGSVTPLCELYNRTTGQWTIVGRLLTARRQHVACFLNTEEILVVGGRDANITTLSSAEIFNLRTGQSRIIADFPFPINFGQSEISSRNKPLVFAGRAGGSNSSRSPNVYEYDSASNRWILVSTIQMGVAAPALIKLYNGQIVTGGGTRAESPNNFSNTVFLEGYPSFQPVAQMSVERHWFAMAQWNSDTVIAIGGFNNNETTLASTEWINLKSNRAYPAPTMIESRCFFSAIGLPQFNGRGQQTISRIVAISGLQSIAGANTPTVEILEEMITPQIPPFPSITSTLTETNNCNVFRLTVRTQPSSDVIRAIELGTSANVTLEVLTALPAASVEILVRLQNPFAPPALTSLRITDDAARTELIPISVSFPQRQNLALSIVGMTDHLFGDSVVTPVCVALRLRNSAPTEAMFPLAYFGRNIEFSAPLSQFPLRIPAGGEAALRLCYTPSALGLQRDTLTLTQNCTTLRIPLVARGVGEVFAGTSRCDVPVKLRTVLPVSGETALIAGTPFPQPSSDIVSVPVYLSAEAPPMQMPTAMLYDGLGRLMGQYEAEWSTGVQSTNLRYSYSGVVPIRTEALPMGFYRMIIRSADGAMTSMGVIIAH